MEFLVAAAVKDDLFLCVRAPNLDLNLLLSILETHRNGTTLDGSVELALAGPNGEKAKPSAAVLNPEP